MKSACALAIFLVIAGLAWAGAQQRRPITAPADHVVTQALMDSWKTELSNWGRWGKDDEKGTLNLITPAKRRQAAALVKDGFVVSLARDAATERDVDNGNPYEHAMVSVRDAASTDRIAVSFHGYAHTHLDGLAHHFLNGKMYNGFLRTEHVTMEGGATKGSIHNIKEGIFTRGILVDLPRLKGVPYLEPGTPIYVEDLEAWEKKVGIKISAGDAVFIRTGRWVRRAQAGSWNVGQSAAGLDASVIPWLRQRDIAVLGSEAALSVVPFPPTSQITNPDDYLPVHNFVLVALGMPLFDDCQLDDLAAAAAARNRWEFLLTAAPLPMVKGTGSPINPTALF
jgi:kynurenine formamidase